jgi:hypothetical protein
MYFEYMYLLLIMHDPEHRTCWLALLPASHTRSSTFCTTCYIYILLRLLRLLLLLLLCWQRHMDMVSGYSSNTTVPYGSTVLYRGSTVGELAQPAQAGRPPEFLVNAVLAQK